MKDKNVKGKQNGIEMELINKRQVSFNIKSINQSQNFVDFLLYVNQYKNSKAWYICFVDR